MNSYVHKVLDEAEALNRLTCAAVALPLRNERDELKTLLAACVTALMMLFPSVSAALIL